MNIELKLNFTSVEEMTAFVTGRGTVAAPANVPSVEMTPAGPAVVETVVTPIVPVAEVPAVPAVAAVPAAPAAVPDLPPMPGAAAAVAEAPDAAFEAVKATLVALSKTDAGPDAVREFLGTYGYGRLSDVPKSQLPTIQADLAAKYPS
jgi:hypothetical protein